MSSSQRLFSTESVFISPERYDRSERLRTRIKVSIPEKTNRSIAPAMLQAAKNG